MIQIVWAGAPRWWEPGRPRPVQFIVMHDTEGTEGTNAAEAGIAYDKVRSDSVSCHIMVDTDTALREVRDVDTAYGSLFHGNAIGIQVEMCHAGVWNLGEPNDAATFDNAAQVAAQLCAINKLPAAWLTVDQVRAAWYADPASRPKGICGHVDVTLAFPEDGGDHTDPGTTFPRAEFIRRVQRYMGQGQGEIKEMRYMFINFADLTSDMDGFGRVHQTDGLRYRIVAKGNYWANLATQAGAGPIVTVDGSTAPAGTTYAGAVAVLCGMLDVESSGGAGVSAAEVAVIADERIAAASIKPAPTA